MKITTRSQRKKAVVELASGEFEASTAETNQIESYVPGPSKSLEFQSEKLDEIKTSLGNEIMFDLAMILADYQKVML